VIFSKKGAQDFSSTLPLRLTRGVNKKCQLKRVNTKNGW